MRRHNQNKKKARRGETGMHACNTHSFVGAVCFEPFFSLDGFIFLSHCSAATPQPNLNLT